MNLKFKYTIIYVSSVEDTLAFYNRAFGFETRMMLDSKEWGELETGSTTLAFATHEMGRINLDDGYRKASMHGLFYDPDYFEWHIHAPLRKASPLHRKTLEGWLRKAGVDL